MQTEVVVFVLVACGLFVYLGARGTQGGRKRKDSDSEEEKTSTSSKGGDLVGFYKKQNVHFVKEKEGYIDTLSKEVEKDHPHFQTLRELAISDAKGKDFFGVKLAHQTWLFPVSQKYLKQLYPMTNLGGKMDAIPFSQAVGYAPRGMPFMETNEHWKGLRKNLAAIFHSDFMEAYFGYFNNAAKDLVKRWKDQSGSTRDMTTDIIDMTYEVACYSLSGGKIDANLPYDGPNGTEELHIRDFNRKVLKDFEQHAATKEFVEDKEYRFKSNSMKLNKLNKNMGTLADALKGVITARAGELGEGAEGKKTIIDAAYGLLTQGVIKDVDEAVQHGWAILNGAQLAMGHALSATLFYLLKNPECFKNLKKEFDDELFKGENWNVENLNEVLTRENLKDMEYLNLVVKEALRLSSSLFGKPMKANQDVKLDDGFVVKKDTIIYPNNGIIGVSENIWKNPLEFVPERFDPESEYFRLPDGGKRDPMAWLAFGAGPRVCMGDNYSMYFIKLALGYFIHEFDIELVEEPKEDALFYWLSDRNYKAKVTSK